MKKIFLLLLFIPFAITTSAQESDVTQSKPTKHRFGFGLTTDLFAGLREMNNFKINTLSEASMNVDPYEELTLFSSSYYSYYFEYQYQFASKWYLSTRLKFNDRNLQYYYSYASNDYNQYNYQSMVINLLDIEVPLMVNYSLPLNDNTNWLTFLGVGASFNISKDDEPIREFKYIDMSGNLLRTYHLDFEIKNNVNYFISLGTGFDFSFKKHKFQTFVAYTAYLKDAYKFNHLTNGSGVVNRDWSKRAFSQNNLEVGLAFFW